MPPQTLYVDLRVGESLHIGDVRVVLEHKSGQLARLAVRADRSTLISLPGRKPTTNPSAHECASSPIAGKEHPHG